MSQSDHNYVGLNRIRAKSLNKDNYKNEKTLDRQHCKDDHRVLAFLWHFNKTKFGLSLFHGFSPVIHSTDPCPSVSNTANTHDRAVTVLFHDIKMALIQFLR